MNQLARHTKVNTRHIVIPTQHISIPAQPITRDIKEDITVEHDGRHQLTTTDPRNKGVTPENFARFTNASDNALKKNIDANRASYDKHSKRWDADKRIEVMNAILTAIAILKSRGIDYDGLTGQPVNPSTCKHTDHDCNGRCYSCGGYFAAGDVSGFMP